MARRTTWWAGIAAAAVVVAVVAYLSIRHEAPVATTVAVVPGAPMQTSPPAPARPPTAAPATASSEITPETVAGWIADVDSRDAGKRAAAISALANAPRADALPVLARQLTDGEPQVDRRLALHSLRDLALNQGDADGRARDAVRHAIYHGDDQTPVDEAQEVLDIIEESERK